MTGLGQLPAPDEFVRHHAGLLVPAAAVEAAGPAAAELRGELVAARELVAVQREDDWLRRVQAAEHHIAMADVDEQTAAAERARRARARDAQEADELGQLYRRASRSGARAQIRAQIQGSAEMRALRVASVRQVALVAGLPVLAAFAAWSTTGAQAGVVRLLHLAPDSPSWWASWGMEPALITIVALIIIGRAILRASGGDTDWRATVAEWTALSLSLALNIFGGWVGGAFWAGAGSALPHSIGPLGCAGTAFLIGLFDGYVTVARPWDGAPRLADLDLVPAVPVADATAVPAPVLAVPVPPVPKRTTGTGTRPAAAGTTAATGTRPVAVRATAAALPAVPGRASTGPGRARAVAAASGTGGRRAISARTGTGAVPGSAKAAARMFWDTETAAGRMPTGAELARAAGKDNDDTGVFRRYAREWAEQARGGGTDAVAS